MEPQADLPSSAASAFRPDPLWLCRESASQAAYQPGSVLLRPSRLARNASPAVRAADADRPASRFLRDGPSEPGHAEGDLIVRPMSRAAVGTLVDRPSRFVRLIHLPDGHRADQPVADLTAQVADISIDE